MPTEDNEGAPEDGGEDEELPSFTKEPADMLDLTQREISARARDNADEGPGDRQGPGDPMMAVCPSAESAVENPKAGPGVASFGTIRDCCDHSPFERTNENTAPEPKPSMSLRQAPTIAVFPSPEMSREIPNSSPAFETSEVSFDCCVQTPWFRR